MIWGQRKQDEDYSTGETLEECTVHLPAPAANVFIGWRLRFEEKEPHARPACSRARLLALCPLHCLCAIRVPDFGGLHAQSLPQLHFLLPNVMRGGQGAWVPCS